MGMLRVALFHRKHQAASVATLGVECIDAAQHLLSVCSKAAHPRRGLQYSRNANARTEMIQL